ncbi:uncharacterized protein LOC135378793 [Ornithodoros turicata]|uniref:uncharacterized protein LOC135378793 n=1 Tax=Ornithodoros turicata TaxID=34597 RepID=UPI00313A25C7
MRCPESQSALVTIPEFLLVVERYSSIDRVIRVTAWVFRYVHNSKRVTAHRSGTLVAEELMEAEKYWFRVTQARFLPAESPHLKTFRHFKDSGGILRLQGRLQCSEQSPSSKHPILLPPPSQAWFTRLILLRERLRMSHAGVQETLHQLREDYWIIKGRQSVKSVLHHCLFCRRLKTRPCVEQEAPLPNDRVTQQLPFEVVGVDFAGPLYYSATEGHLKSYVALFTCAVTRAVHLELVTGQSHATFLMAFKRFASRRGLPTNVYSDNFLTFKKATKEYPAMMSSQFQDVQEYVAQRRISWEFIVEHAACPGKNLDWFQNGSI